MQSACASLYRYLWPVRPYLTFPHYLTKDTIFGKNFTQHKCVFWFSLQLLSGTFFILRRIEQDIIKNKHKYPCKYPLLAAFGKWRKATISSVMSARLAVTPVRMEQLGSHWRIFMKFGICGFFRNYVGKNSCFVYGSQERPVLYMETFVHSW